MPSEFEVTMNKLIEQLDITSVQKTFLLNAYVTSLPIMGAGEDDDNEYLYLATPSHHRYISGDKKNLTQGITSVVTIKKETGQHKIREVDLYQKTDSLELNTLRNIVGVIDSASKLKLNVDFVRSLYFTRNEKGKPSKLSLDYLHKHHITFNDNNKYNEGLQSCLKVFDVDPIVRTLDVSELIDRTLLSLVGNDEICERLRTTFVQEVYKRFSAFVLSVDIATDLRLTDKLREKIGNYDSYELNFILGGEGRAKLYRQEFIEQCHQMLDEPQYNSEKKSLKELTSSKHLLSTFYRSFFAIDSDGAMASIDSGKFPLKEVGHSNYRSLLTKKQLKSAIGDWKDFAIESPLNATGSSLIDFIELSSLPRNWIIRDQDNYRALDFHSALQNNYFRQSLLACAKQIDKFKESGDKGALKALAKEWSWLSSEGEQSIDERYKSLNDKNGGGHFYDYGKILLETFVMPIQLRVFSENPEYFDKAFHFNDTYMEVRSNDNLPSSGNQFFLDKGIYTKSIEIDEEPPFGDVTFDTLDSTDMLAIIHKTTGISSLMKASHNLHKSISAINTNLSSYHTEKLSWTPVIADTFTEGDLSIDSISDRQALSEEGTEMDHCCYSLLSACLKGKSYIFSIKEEGVRAATLELRADPSDAAGEWYVCIEQLFGKSNSDVSPKIQSFAERFVDKLESHQIKSKFHITSYNQNLLDNCNYGGLDNYCHLQSVPYHTDAALLTLVHLDKHLNKFHKNMSRHELFEHCGGAFGELFKVSNLKKEYDNLLTLSHENGVSPELIIETKNAHKCVNMDQAITVLQKNKRVTESIKNTSAGLPIDCTPDEQYEQISKMLSNQYSISLPVSEIAKLNMNNLFENITVNLNSKENELQNDLDVTHEVINQQTQKKMNMATRSQL